MKGVEKGLHALLTAVEPDLMGVRALRSVVTAQSLLRLQPADVMSGQTPQLFMQKSSICDIINWTCG